MRFNSRELAFLAQQPPDRFDKQGTLLIREKQEGLFRKGEAYVERLFRLRGNLLFYFKTKDPSSEVLGAFVLERCVVELDMEEDKEFSFILVFEGDDDVHSIYLAARTERERDSWIETLHIASYECMKIQLQSLREQLRARTGKDPIENPDPSTLPEYQPGESPVRGEPFLEMCVTCDGLPEVNGKGPDTFASIHYMLPPQQQWMPHAHTEIVEKNSRPMYLTTIGFSDPQCASPNVKLKLVVYYVKERMTNTMAQIGSVVFPMTDLVTAPNSRLRLRLKSSSQFIDLYHRLSSHDSQDVGNVTIMAWQTDLRIGMGTITEVPEEDLTHLQKSCALPRSSSSKRQDMLKPLYENIITRTYRFPTNNSKELSVHEYMAESKLTYSLPKQLLKIWVEEEKKRIELLQDLGELSGRIGELVGRELTKTTTSANYYQQAADHFEVKTGAPFKPSAKKGHKEVEFAPTNLHLERIWVQNSSKKTSACYDITTSGAFTAYAQKFKHGGLRRMLKQMQDVFSENNSGKPKLEHINEVLNSITTVREAVDQYCDAVCRSAVQSDSADLNNSMAVLSDKTRQLIQVCENPLVEQGISSFTQAKLSMEDPTSRPQSDGLLSASNTGHDPSPEKNWKWSGTDFIKSPTQEPWDLTRLNTEAAVVCVLSKVEDLISNGYDSTQWLPELSPLVIKLKRCVEVMCSRAKSGLTFMTVEECGKNIALLHTVKYRRDVVFSQAITAATSGFITKLRSSITDDSFLRQIFQIGILMEFESLLSCHANELAMLEDMAVGVVDLSHVVFKIEQAAGPDDILPTIKGNRTGYIVHIPVAESIFHLLPKELQRGRPIRVVPVLFSMGINEQATMAEKFGNLSVQEAVNADSYTRLQSYWEKFHEIVGEPESAGRNSLPMDQLMRHLHINVMSKKSKNTEVLFLAAELCRKMNGIRFTSCKSGKDRTAMGITLELVQLLQREHDLAAHVFMQALECIRSEGVRRENTMKNTGTRKYAFNSIQLLSLPKLYRAPNGTYGNTHT